MKYQLDNYVFYDIDEMARLLFESKLFYIYIWFDVKLFISAFQICDTNRDKGVNGRLDSSGLIAFYSNESIENKIKLKELTISIFTEVENRVFSKMFKYLSGLKIEDEISYQLVGEEKDYFEKMPKSIKYG
jgi:hypothetical protein